MLEEGEKRGDVKNGLIKKKEVTQNLGFDGSFQLYSAKTETLDSSQAVPRQTKRGWITTRQGVVSRSHDLYIVNPSIATRFAATGKPTTSISFDLSILLFLEGAAPRKAVCKAPCATAFQLELGLGLPAVEALLGCDGTLRSIHPMGCLLPSRGYSVAVAQNVTCRGIPPPASGRTSGTDTVAAPSFCATKKACHGRSLWLCNGIMHGRISIVGISPLMAAVEFMARVSSGRRAVANRGRVH